MRLGEASRLRGEGLLPVDMVGSAANHGGTVATRYNTVRADVSLLDSSSPNIAHMGESHKPVTSCGTHENKNSATHRANIYRTFVKGTF